MKLHAEDVFGFEHRRVRDRVVAGRSRGIGHRRVIAVSEIKIGSWREVLQELRTVARRFHLVPSHVRHARRWPESAGSRLETSQARALRALLRSTRTTPAGPGRSRGTERPRECVRSAPRGLAADPAHASFGQNGRRRENDFGRVAEPGGIANQFMLSADFTQRVLNRAKIARAVIENR